MGMISEERVNLVNANVVANNAASMSWKRKIPSAENYTSMVTLVATTDKGATTVAATVLRGEPHVVRINDYWVGHRPERRVLLFADQY